MPFYIKEYPTLKIQFCSQSKGFQEMLGLLLYFGTVKKICFLSKN